MENNQLEVCYAFLKELDHELDTRVSGLETSVCDCNALLHRLLQYNERSAESTSAPTPTPPPVPSRNVSAAVGKGDELDLILEQARRIRLKEDKPKAKPPPASSVSARTTRQHVRAAVKTSASAMPARSGASSAKGDKGDTGGGKEADLGRILEVARGIRRKEKDDGGSAGGKQGAMSFSAAEAHTEAIEILPPVASLAQEERHLVKVDGHRVEKLFADIWATDRFVCAAEARVLSDGAGCQVFPRSVPYLSLRAAMAPTGMPTPPTAALTEGGASSAVLKSDRSSCYDALSAALKENRVKYTKHMKRLLREGEKVSNVGPTDREELFSCWYEHQSLLELYELMRLDRLLAVNSGSSSDGMNSIADVDRGMPWELQTALDTIRALPKAAPLDFRKSAAAFLEPAWLESSLREIDLFNESLKTRTKYAVETVFARTVLKECMHNLKQCTIRSRQGEDSGKLRSDWIDALRQYRSVWSCLTRETKGAGTVSFVHR